MSVLQRYRAGNKEQVTALKTFACTFDYGMYRYKEMESAGPECS